MAFVVVKEQAVSEVGSTLLDWLSVLGFFALQVSIATGSLQALF